MPKIKNVKAREILDSRGFPTIEAEVIIEDSKSSGSEFIGRAIVPSGASTGEGEALELRDGDQRRFLGKGVLKAVQNVRDLIRPSLVDREFSNQSQLDRTLLELDGTPNKSKLGANAILAVSMAHVRAQSLYQKIPTHVYLASLFGTPGAVLPVPLMNILNGGKHADNGLAIQEFMIVPIGFQRFSDALRAGTEVFHHLKKILHKKGLSTGVGDEGGFAPVFEGQNPHEQAIQCILQAVSDAGYQAGKNIWLALDSAASEFSPEKGNYKFEGNLLTSQEMIGIYQSWAKKYPIISIEDGLAEHDWDGWKSMTQSLGTQCQLVGDDLFVTNPKFLQQGIDNKTANSILIKLNQIGTVTETIETMKLGFKSGYHSIVSHRSGETEDTFIADLAVGSECGQIKTGSASRTDRIAKYNQLLRLEEFLGDRAHFAGSKAFERFQKR